MMSRLSKDFKFSDIIVESHFESIICLGNSRAYFYVVSRSRIPSHFARAPQGSEGSVPLSAIRGQRQKGSVPLSGLRLNG